MGWNAPKTTDVNGVPVPEQPEPGTQGFIGGADATTAATTTSHPSDAPPPQRAGAGRLVAGTQGRAKSDHARANGAGQGQWRQARTATFEVSIKKGVSSETPISQIDLVFGVDLINAPSRAAGTVADAAPGRAGHHGAGVLRAPGPSWLGARAYQSLSPAASSHIAQLRSTAALASARVSAWPWKWPIASVRCDAAIRPVLRVKRTRREHRETDAVDPTRTSMARAKAPDRGMLTPSPTVPPSEIPIVDLVSGEVGDWGRASN